MTAMIQRVERRKVHSLETLHSARLLYLFHKGCNPPTLVLHRDLQRVHPSMLLLEERVSTIRRRGGPFHLKEDMVYGVNFLVTTIAESI